MANAATVDVFTTHSAQQPTQHHKTKPHNNSKTQPAPCPREKAPAGSAPPHSERHTQCWSPFWGHWPGGGNKTNCDGIIGKTVCNYFSFYDVWKEIYQRKTDGADAAFSHVQSPVRCVHMLAYFLFVRIWIQTTFWNNEQSNNCDVMYFQLIWNDKLLSTEIPNTSVLSAFRSSYTFFTFFATIEWMPEI